MNYRDASGKIYGIADSNNLGCLKESIALNKKVSYKSRLSFREKGALLLVGLLALTLNITFLGLVVLPSFHFGTGSIIALILASVAFVSILLVEFIRILQFSTLWFFTLFAKDPVPVLANSKLRVAILTTIVPNKEPLDIVLQTLIAMKAIKYAGKTDVWLLDEGNDPEVKRAVEAFGVKHFSRKGIEKYNQPEGFFKAKTKSGNHNAWRDMYENDYDVVAQMDPDHIPFPNFLERTIGYFNDTDIAFVVAPQVYGNQKENRVAKASAGQAYIFHGVIQRGANGLGVPLLIGTNHIYRTTAWKQIGGYQDSIIEDHLTSMKIYSEKNPLTGNYWKGLYTPDVLSIGEGPQTWTDYFNQQKRWAYGIWEIILKHDWKILRKMQFKQALGYMSLQFFYPSVALTTILGIVSSAIYFIFGITAVESNNLNWVSLWSVSLFTQMGFYFWLARFNLTKYEQGKIGLDAILLTLFTIPVYTAAAFMKILRRPLTYAVTAKGDMKSQETLSTFKSHIYLVFIYLGLLLTGLFSGRNESSSYFWTMFLIFCNLLPIFIFAATVFMKLRMVQKTAIVSTFFTAFIGGIFTLQGAHSFRAEEVKAEVVSVKPTQDIQKRGNTILAETPKKKSEILYQVKNGDSLWSISEEYYKEGAKWEDIVKNNPQLNAQDPQSLPVNTIIRLN